MWWLKEKEEERVKSSNRASTVKGFLFGLLPQKNKVRLGWGCDSQLIQSVSSVWTWQGALALLSNNTEPRCAGVCMLVCAYSPST